MVTYLVGLRLRYTSYFEVTFQLIKVATNDTTTLYLILR